MSINCCFVSSGSAEAHRRAQHYIERFGQHERSRADVLVAIGGDGFMLQCLSEALEAATQAQARASENGVDSISKQKQIALYGVRCGTVGFLMNEDSEELMSRITEATSVRLSPLTARFSTRDAPETERTTRAFNEIALVRRSVQSARLRVRVDGVERLNPFIGDGLMVATPAGSSAYNLSAGGAILPIGSPLLAVTPVCAQKPLHWRGAVLSNEARIQLDNLDVDKRPLALNADNREFLDVRHVEVTLDKAHAVTVLFDPRHDLEARIVRQQFLSSF